MTTADNTSFRRISGFLIAIYLLCAVVSFGVAEMLAEKEVFFRTAEFQATNQVVLHAAIENLRAIISEADRLTAFMKNDIEASGRIQEYVHSLIWADTRSFPFEEVIVSDSDGMVIFSGAPIYKPYVLTSYNHFKAHVAHDTKTVYFGAEPLPQTPERAAIFISRRVNDRDGSFRGVAAVGISSWYVSNLFRQIQLGPENTLVLLSMDGRMLARHPATLTVEQAATFRQHPVIQAVRDEGKLSGRYESPGAGDGKPRLGVYEAVANYPVIVMVSTEKSAVFREAQERRRVYYSWASAFSILAGVSMLVFWTRLRRQRLDEKRIKESQLKFHNIVAASPLGIHIYHLDEPDRLVLIHANSAADRMLGIEHQRLFDKTIEDAFPGLVETPVPSMYRQIARDEIPLQTFEIPYQDERFSGTYLVSVFSIGPGDIAVFFMDITDRKQMEEELRLRRDHLEELVEQRTGELVAVNEELTAMNEEINAINSDLQTANRKLDDEVKARQSKEHELLFVSRQYQAAANLLTRSNEDAGDRIQSILSDALQLINAPAGYIGIFDEASRTVIRKHNVGPIDFTSIDPQPIDSGAMSQLFATGETIVIRDYVNFASRLPDTRLGRVSSVVMVPLKSGPYVKGLLAAHWLDETYPIRNEDIDILQQFSDLAAVVLEQIQTHESVKQLAYHDTLTGLPNRSNLNERLNSEMEKAVRGEACGSVFFIDLDDLKIVNDTFGHELGDKVITAASRRILETVDEGAFVSRVGGDEFVVILPHETSREMAGNLAERLLQALSGEQEIAGRLMKMSASIGIAFYPLDGATSGDILKNADSAMYAAKAAGRNCWQYYRAELAMELYEKMLLTNSLRYALERGELMLHYQPIIDAKHCGIIGFEALLRWNSLEHGHVPPDRFIPCAEHSGLIIPIGDWVVGEACRFAAGLARRGVTDVHVAVNISPRQLASEHFVEHVSHCIASAGIKAGQLVVEVTESMLIEAMETGIEKLAQLRELGVQVSLDDFGTGYSSLTYLLRLPVNILKIDKSFIDRVAEDDAQAKLVGFMIDLAHSLGLLVIAEGVESELQQNYLAQAGCDCIQGFVFSRPIAAEEALELLGPG